LAIGFKRLFSEGRFVLSTVPGMELIISMMTNGQLEELGFNERSKAADQGHLCLLTI
jgi:hypothetical protein